MKETLNFIKHNKILTLVCHLPFIIAFAILWRAFPGINLFKWLLIVSGIYPAGLFLTMMVYAWIINPIRSLIKKRKGE